MIQANTSKCQYSCISLQIYWHYKHASLYLALIFFVFKFILFCVCLCGYMQVLVEDRRRDQIPWS